MSSSSTESVANKGYTTVRTAPLTLVRGPASFIPKRKEVPLPKNFFRNVFGIGLLTGAALELFMIKTGFYGTVTKLEGEKIQERRPEYEAYKRQLTDYYQKEVLPIIEKTKRGGQ